MSTVGLFQSNWGYLSNAAKLSIAIRTLSCLFQRSKLIQNLSLHTPDKVADLTNVDITSIDDLKALETHIETHRLPDSRLHNTSLVGYSKLDSTSDIWLQYRSDKLLLRVSAEDSVAPFLSAAGDSSRKSADIVISLATEIATLNKELKEIVGRFQGGITFFVGEPQLLYRPPLLERFYRSRRFDDAVKPFWDMYSKVSQVVPADLTALATRNGVDCQEVAGSKISVRFCRGFADIVVDANKLFDEVARKVESELQWLGIEKTWD